ncbi:unnamed protein product [Leptidea sinapis]|uniref:Uncharacterized protein n=1 Tax=Leptidea sinapis TaxID=189913 RepID=A0A5E4R3R1_9NEOP|nr:unnamed protein product [Leptidea sinapis]
MEAQEKPPKYDPNTEAFQMRAQWKKVDICRKQWHDQWSWLLAERKRALQESNSIRAEAAAALPHIATAREVTKTLKPVPATSTGVIGWLAAKPECALEIYSSWIPKIPVRMKDPWEDSTYLG